MSLGSFVQGAFQGHTFGENVKDRKAERKRNEERFQWERDAQEWGDELKQRDRENWRYTDELRGRQRTQWERAEEQRRKEEALQAELDQIRNEGFEDWQRGQDGQPVPENTPQGTVRVPFAASDGTGQAAPAPARATFPGMNVPGLSGPNPNAAPLRFGDDVPRMENRPIRVPLGQAGDDTLAGNMGGTGSTGGGGTGGGGGGDMILTDIQPVRGTYSEEERRARVQPQDTALTPNANNRAAVDYPYNPSSPESRDGRMNPGGARGRPLLADMMDAAPEDTQEETGTPEAAPGASVRRKDRAPDLAPVEDQGPTFTDERLSRRPGYTGRQQQDAPQAPQPSIGSRSRAGLDAPAAPQPVGQPEAEAAQAAQPAQQQAPAPTPQGGGAGQPVYGGMTASQAAQFQDLPAPRMALEDGGQPISIARDSLASNANADNQGQTPQVTEQQRAQGAATFREYYQTQVVPRQVEALYRNGEIEAAEQLQTWFEDERSQGLQENYARAVHAASIGDERGFFDHLGKVYNSYDDGYSFIADESDLFKNDAGQTVAKITLENTATGERFTQEYEGGDELIQQVLTQMDPISIFEQLKGQAQAEAEAAAEQHAWEIKESRRRITDGFETPSDRRKVFSDAWKQLSESSPNWLSMSPEEKVISVEDFLAQADTFATGGSAQPEAPVYLGQ